jgi:hypothetical protein
VKLHVDLETLQLIAGPGQRSPVAALRFKRGDAARLQVIFLENGLTPTTIGDPGILEIQIGIKPRNQFDQSYLAHSTVWTMPSEGDDVPAYGCELSFNTLQLNAALNVGAESAEELAEITLMGEITWREGSGESTSTRTFLVVVENDVNRGTEGVPMDASPPYPLPGEIELRANKGIANGYAALDATGKLSMTTLPSHPHAVSDMVSQAGGFRLFGRSLPFAGPGEEIPVPQDGGLHLGNQGLRIANALTGAGDPTKRLLINGTLTSNGSTPVVFPVLIEAPNHNGKPQYSNLGDGVMEIDGASNHRCYYSNQILPVSGSFWEIRQISPPASWRGPINGNEEGPENVSTWTPQGASTGAPIVSGSGFTPGFTPPTGTRIGQLYLNSINNQLYYWDGDSWHNSAGNIQTRAQQLARSSAAFNAGPEDTTPADNDRLAVTSPTAGWLSLTRLWTYIAGRLNTLSGAFTVGGNWSFTGQTQLAATQAANNANSAMTSGLVAARYRLAHTGSSEIISLNTTEYQDVLSLPVEAGKTYSVYAIMHLIASPNTGVNYALSFPAGIARTVRSRSGSSVTVMAEGSVHVGLSGLSFPTPSATTAEIRGYFVCQTSGLVRLQFSKHVVHPDQVSCKNTSLQITEH